MKSIKSIIAFLDGKKTALGALAGMLLNWAMVRGWLHPADAGVLASVISFWTGGAILDKWRKGEFTTTVSAPSSDTTGG